MIIYTFISYSFWTILAMVISLLGLIAAFLLYSMTFEKRNKAAIEKWASNYPNAAAGTHWEGGGYITNYMPCERNDQMSIISQDLADKHPAELVGYYLPMLRPGTFGIVLNGAQAMKEFSYLGNENSTRMVGGMYHPGLKLGFLSKSSQPGQAHRSIYLDFFLYDRVQLLKDPMEQIMDIKQEELIIQYKLSKSEPKEIHMREFLGTIMYSWVTRLLFGCQDESEISVDLDTPAWKDVRNFKNDNIDFSDYKKISQTKMGLTVVETAFSSFREKKNLYLFNLPAMLGCTKKWSKHHKLVKLLDAEIMKLYNKRFQFYCENILDHNNTEATNVIDLLVRHNKKCIDNGNFSEIIKDEEIIGDIMAFMLAGVDTSLQVSTTCISKLAKDQQDWITKIREEGVNSVEEMLNNKSLGHVIKETIRLWSPAPTGFSRRLTKDIEVAGVKLPKGCQVMIPGNLNRFSPNFQEAQLFKPDRWFDEKNEKAYSEFNPFYQGRRKCLGYQLADLNMRMMIGGLIRGFDMKLDEKHGFKTEISGVIQQSKPYVQLKLR